VPGAVGHVGPSLEGLLYRVYIGGALQNTPDNLVAWIVDPLRFSQHTAMPPTGIRDREARDVAAYLYAH
jgi:cytochrome c1